MTKTIGVIGLGSIGGRHARNLLTIGRRVIGYDPNMTHGDIPSGHLENIRDRSDAIVIATPTNQHCIEWLETPPHLPVFMEKPIGSTQGCLDEYGRGHRTLPIMVGYNLRFHSCVKKAKEWLDAGLIGEPIWANFTLGQFNDRPPYLRDGVILNWSHEIDLCLYLLGPAVVDGSSTRLTDGKDEMTDILLTHKSGCRSTVHLDYITTPERRKFRIVGSLGIIDANLVTRKITTTDMKDRVVKGFRGKDTWNDNYIEEMQAFLDRIDGKETIGCTGEEGLEVLKICLEVRKQASLT